LKLLHNSNKQLLQTSISAIPMVEASLTLSFLYQYLPSQCCMSQTMVWCFVCHWISAFRFDLLHGRKCTFTHICASKCRVYFSV